MSWRPAYRVEVDGEDVTGAFSARLNELTVTDAAGFESDSVQMTLTDMDPVARLAEPGTGAEIRVWLGMAPAARYMGLYIADRVEISGPPDIMTISGRAAPHGESSGGKTALTEQKTRSWPEGTTIGDLVATVAGDHNMQPAVSKSLEGVTLEHIDQIAESDMHLLTRIARERDALFKPGDGKLVMAKRGESATASGKAMPLIALTPRDVTSWSTSRSLREKPGKVVAVHRDLDKGKDVEKTAGDGKPERRLRRRYPTEDTAQKAADAEHERQVRAGRSLQVSLPGDPDIVAEARLQLTGFRSYVDGEWLITRAVHRLGEGGYSCEVTAEPPGGAE